MPRRLLIAALVVLLIGLVGVEAFRAWQWPVYAKHVAEDAAHDTLGPDFFLFTGPVRTGTTLLRNDAYHWERASGGAPIERVTYFRSEERLCRSVLEQGRWQDRGCISTRKYEF